MAPENFIEGKDFEITDDGRVIMTRSYLLKRGHCCSSGCKNCPFDFEHSDPTTPQELCLSSSTTHEEEGAELDPLSEENIQLKLHLYEDQID